MTPDEELYRPMTIQDLGPIPRRIKEEQKVYEMRQIVVAKRWLGMREYKGIIRYCGVTLDHFNAEELRKIVELSMKYAAQERNMYEADRKRLNTFKDGWKKVAMEDMPHQEEGT